ncbi:MAG: hypothetical protein P4L40_12475 [Terracidiphilus sp.]|nr:hypothetical protein [Terracidiphilus sp.]
MPTYQRSQRDHQTLKKQAAQENMKTGRALLLDGFKADVTNRSRRTVEGFAEQFPVKRDFLQLVPKRVLPGTTHHWRII